VRSAEHDLQFSLFGGDGAPAAKKADVAYRQTLVLLTRSEDLQNMVRFVFDEMDSLPRWNADFRELHRAIVELQRLEKTKGAAGDVKTQFLATDERWEKLVTKFKELPEDQHLLLRVYFGQVDQVFARLARIVGVTNRRASLKADFI